MRTRARSPLLLFGTVVLIFLNACNLGVVQPESASPAVALEETPALIITTPTVDSTATLVPTIVPTFTVTLFHNVMPTVTPTPQWTGCPGIVVNVDDTKKGDILHILRCEDGLEYDLGPIAKGVFAVGPNNKFIIYVSNDGLVYAARIGDRYLNALYHLGREHIFTVFNKKVTPDFRISFAGEDPIYRLILLEKNYDQKRMYDLPVGITQ